MTINEKKYVANYIHELEEYKSRTESILNNSALSLITTDIEGIIQYYNVGAERMLLYKKTDIINKTSIIEFSDALEILRRAQCLSKTLHKSIDTGFDVFTAKANQGIEDESVWTYIRQDGIRIPVLLNISPLYSTEDKINGYLFLAKDISQQYKAENKVDELSKKMSVIVDNIIDCIITTDSKGAIQSFNKAAEETFGYQASETLGKSVETLMPTSHATNHQNYMDRFKETGESEIVGAGREATAMRKDGTIFPIDIGVTEIWIDENRHFTALIRDITDRKHYEQALVTAKENAESSNRAKSNFLANISHELRTPMHAILSYSSLGIRKTGNISSEKTKAYFEKIEQSGERLLNMINSLLVISKLESGQLELQSQESNLVDIYRNVMVEMELLFKEKLLHITENLAFDHADLKCDKEKIQLVVKSLISNAIKFTPNGSIIYVSISEWEENSNYVKFSISDQGVGIPQEELEKVFGSFEQSSYTNTGAGGAGLGLSISKEIVELHLGKIYAGNKNDGGAEFYFILPK